MEQMTETLAIETINTEVIGAESEDSIFISQNAIEQVKKIKEANSVPDEYSLRLGTRSGGCSGMNYIIGFDSEISDDNDKLVNIQNMGIVIDRKSLFYLMGVTLDYVNDESGSGFVFNNPNNEKTCGCGGGGHH